MTEKQSTSLPVKSHEYFDEKERVMFSIVDASVTTTATKKWHIYVTGDSLYMWRMGSSWVVYDVNF